MKKRRGGFLRLWLVMVVAVSLIGYYGCDTGSSSSSSSTSSTGGCDTGSSSSTSSTSSTSSSSSTSSTSSGGSDVTLTLQENGNGFCRVDGTIDSNNDGYTGSGFANTTNSDAYGIEWAVNSPSSGNVTLRWRYANGSTSRSSRVVVNGQTVATIQMGGTGAWTTWADSDTVQVALSSGVNRIFLQATNAAGLANIDTMTVSGTGISVAACNADSLPRITLWIAGDSTVANGSSTGCPVGWGRSIATYFNSKVSVTNAAVGGRSVRTWLYDVQSTMDSTGECVLGLNSDGTPTIQARWQNMLDNMKPGDYLLIQFGINDGDSSCPRHVGSAAFKASYGMMANAAKARGTYPVFITPVSAIACSGSTAVATRGFITETYDAGDTYVVPVIDLHQRSIALYNSEGFCPIPGGSDVSASTTGAVGAFFCDDHTHFEASGALEIGGLVAQGVLDSGVSLADYLQ